ncbi:hypothetical protein [Burkholderia pseudomallei]|uniref:hypothetical protein n=1 Tax=Burkholderia pseudomallei TaxID=28450 RepID=UPI002468DD49|nr:hypothetical protein [Burkholderia pseudomallei]
MNMPDRLTIIGPDERTAHYHFPPDATAWFWGEYTPYEHTGGQNWNYSPTNRLMSNFKKKMDHRGRPDWPYKAAAINQVALAFAQFYTWPVMHQPHRIALVPIPPSKVRTDPMYDPRMHEMLVRMAGYVGLPLDIRDCLSFSGQYGASHLNGVRPTPDQLHADLTFDPVAGRQQQPPGAIMVFDDVLTAGSHYAAVSRKLRDVFPNVPIYGSFIARRVIPNPFADVVIDL